MKHIILGEKTLVMGILNVTPDSFSDGDQYTTIEKATTWAKTMLEEGADIIDVGGESSRPGSKPITQEEEMERILPTIKTIRQKLGNDFLLSVDTYKSEVAEGALSNGADLVNSMGGFMFDKGLVDVVKKYKCQIVIYHIKGIPKTMQYEASESSDIIQELEAFFTKQIRIGTKAGISKDQFIIDPGIGFGKTLKQNLEIIKRLGELKDSKLPILIGVSRKSHLGKILEEDLHLKDVSPTERLEAGLAETGVAVLQGAQIVRTHDVLSTKKYLAVLDRVKNL